MKRIIGYCIAFLLLTAEVCGKQVKSDLSVLYEFKINVWKNLL